MLGISVANFALTGLLISSSRTWLRLLLVNIMPIAISFILPHIAAIAHLYGLIAGFLIGFILSPRFNV